MKKVFISWSGELSKKVSKILGDWIEEVLQGVEVWASYDDIDKGSIWFTELTEQLKVTGIGIICVTRGNMTAPWLSYELGALTKGLTKNRVVPLLVNLTPKDLPQPLSQFNATQHDKDDMKKLIVSMIKSLEHPIKDDRLTKQFDKYWDDYNDAFNKLIAEGEGSQPAPKSKDPNEILSELLSLSRSVHSKISTLEQNSLIIPSRSPSTNVADFLQADLSKGQFIYDPKTLGDLYKLNYSKTLQKLFRDYCAKDVFLSDTPLEGKDEDNEDEGDKDKKE